MKYLARRTARLKHGTDDHILKSAMIPRKTKHLSLDMHRNLRKRSQLALRSSSGNQVDVLPLVAHVAGPAFKHDVLRIVPSDFDEGQE